MRIGVTTMRVEQARPVGDGDDVAIAGRRRADHREIDDVDEADSTVVRVLEPVALEPMDQDQDSEQTAMATRRQPRLSQPVILGLRRRTRQFLGWAWRRHRYSAVTRPRAFGSRRRLDEGGDFGLPAQSIGEPLKPSPDGVAGQRFLAVRNAQV